MNRVSIKTAKLLKEAGYLQKDINILTRPSAGELIENLPDGISIRKNHGHYTVYYHFHGIPKCSHEILEEALATMWLAIDKDKKILISQ